MKPQSQVLLLLVVALAGGAWFLARGARPAQPVDSSAERQEDARRTGTESEGTAQDDVEALALADAIESEMGMAPSRRSARVIELRDSETDTPAASFDGPTRSVLVEVAWPDEARPTGPVDVFVFDRGFSGGNVLSAFDSIPRRESKEPSENRLMFGELASDHWTPERIRASVLTAGPALAPRDDEASGVWRARLDVPEGAGRTFAHVLGSTYLTVRPAIIDPNVDRVRVTPSRGAQLTIEVVADEGIDAAHARFHVEEDQSAAAMMAGNSDPEVGLRIRGETDENGAATLGTVPAGLPLTVSVEHEESAPATASVDALIPGTTGFVRLHLHRGATVAGVCQTPNGVPVQGAEVRLYLAGRAFGFDDQQIRETVTDAEGRFELNGAPDGEIVVRANADTLLQSKRELIGVENGEGPDDVVLVLEDGRSISGTVVDTSGRPVAGAVVEARFDLAKMMGPGSLNATRGTRASGTSSDDGSFEIKGLGAGPFSVTARTNDENGPLDRRDAVSPGTENLELVLRPGALILGQVVDDTGEPVAGTEVVCARLGTSQLGDLRLAKRRYTTDEDGMFATEPLAPGLWECSVATETHITVEPYKVDLAPVDAGHEMIGLVAARAASARGVVLDPEGVPLEGAVVAIEIDGPSWRTPLTGAPGPESTRSAEDGSFLLLGLPPGEAALTATNEGLARGSTTTLTLEAGATIEDLTIELTRGGAIEGVCFDADGKPTSNRLVTITETTLGVNKTLPAEADGTFLAEGLSPGSYSVISIDPAAQMSGDLDAGNMAMLMKSMKMASARVIEGETVQVFLGAPATDPVTVTGRVTQGGEPYAGAMVNWHPATTGMYEKLKFETTDAEGRYEVELDEPGEYIVQVARLPGDAGQQQSIEYSRTIEEGVSAQEIDFVVPGGTIAGRVLGSDGEPASGVRLSAMSRGAVRTDRLFGDSYAEISTAADGRFEVSGLRPGRYQIAAGGQPLLGQSAIAPARVHVGDFVLREDERIDDVEIRLPEPGEIEVTVTDDTGTPVRSATVFLRDVEGRHTELFSGHSTGIEGKVTLRGVAPGDYTVCAHTGELATEESAAVSVKSGETATVGLLARSGTTIVAIPKVRGDEPFPVTTVEVLDSRGRDVTRRIGIADIQNLYTDNEFSTSRRRIGPLAPGTYTVTATARDGRSATRDVTLDGSRREKRVILTLRNR